MDFTIEKRELQRALRQVCGIIPRRTTLPILGNIAFRVADGKLSLSASDLEIEANTTSHADIHAAGGTTLPGLTLLEIVTKLPEGAINITQTERGVRVDAGSSRYDLPTLPLDEFPQTLDEALPVRFSLDAKVLKTAFDRTLPFASSDEQRNYLNGLYLHSSTDDHTLRWVATDAHRLARHALALPEQDLNVPGVIVPRRAATIVRSMLDGSSEEAVSLALSTHKVRFALGSGVYLVAKLVEGNYPPYEKVIPMNNPHCMTVKRSHMLAAVERTMIVLSERSKKIELNVTETTLDLKGSGAQTGEAHESLLCQFDQPQFNVPYNSQYLKDILENMIDDEISFYWSESKNPVLIKGKDNTTTLYVLTPLRVS